MNDPYPSLHQTVHVAADGTVTHGGPVSAVASNVRGDNRIVAVASHVVHSRRFAPNLLPTGVDAGTTTPHDCNNHLRAFESRTDEAARAWYNRPVEAVAA